MTCMRAPFPLACIHVAPLLRPQPSPPGLRNQWDANKILGTAKAASELLGAGQLGYYAYQFVLA